MSKDTQTVAFLDYFSGWKDPRQAGKVLFPLGKIFLLTLCALLSGAEKFTEISEWGEMKIDFLRRFLPYDNGAPSHDALNDIFNALDPTVFRDAFIEWGESLRTVAPELDGPEVRAIDGKTSR